MIFLVVDTDEQSRWWVRVYDANSSIHSGNVVRWSERDKHGPFDSREIAEHVADQIGGPIA